MEIRIATVDDAEQLLNIYRPYVEKTAISFEYEVPSLEEFKGRIENTLKKYPYLVATDDNGEIKGYCYCGVFKARAAYDYSVETTIYLREDARGNGLGRCLYSKLEEYAKLQNIKNLNACIATCEIEDETLTNASKRFHERLGYRLVGEFTNSGYKFNRWYNMIWMEKIIGEHESTPAPFIPFCNLNV
ncbi:MAG: GNAT family N-acetyltransferase [Lachnospiraceae bacterium]|nr:GNAT family N-acetyltransferase [Lachnospiraceae bacterium]